MTMPVPKERDRGRLRLGFFTSAAVKGMLFQASTQNSAPTIATLTNEIVPIIHVGWSGGYQWEAERGALRQKSVNFAARATAVENQKTSRTRQASAPVLVTVKMFWMILPRRRPRVLVQDRKTIDTMASRFWRFSPTLYGPSEPNHSCQGPIVPTFQIQAEAENHGSKTAVNLAKAMPTAAMVAV